MTFDALQTPTLTKSESRPFLIDWNRDGRDDVVVMLWVDGKDDDEMICRLFVNTQRELSGLAESANDDTTNSARDAQWKFRQFDWGTQDPMKQNDRNLRTHKRKTVIHFAFNDFDRDGRFDAIFSETPYRIDLVIDKESGSFRRYEKISSSIYFMKNLAKTGEPRFGPPVKIFEAGDRWGINSIALADVTNDGHTDVVAGMTRTDENNPRRQQTELWLLQAR